MPPKPKYSPEDIIDVAFDIVRQSGWDALTARSIAEKMNSSTMPIYLHFDSMDDLAGEIIKKALSLLLEYQMTPRTNDPVLDLGVGYVLFAREERPLFKGIMDEQHGPLLREHGEANFNFLLDAVSEDPRYADLSPEQRRKLLFVQWVFIHGLAHLNNSIPLENFEAVDLVDLLRESDRIFLRGLFSGLGGGGSD